MSKLFRELLQKVGSGAHTSKKLTRTEAAMAARLMLTQEATPAQIGAFLIAHRIARPTGEELAGMLDTYDELGPALPAISATRPVLILGSPYDGRSRTASLSPLTALVIAAAGGSVLLQGGDVMPTKYGVPLVQTWQALGVDWTRLTLDQVWHVLDSTGVGFVYLPKHFPLAQGLVAYRDEIGKRPPLATLELIWSPYRGNTHIVSGYVHPPTEDMIRDACALRGVMKFTTVKGLEGSCDLPRDRTAILGLGDADHFERLCLHPSEYGFASKSTPLDNPNDHAALMASVLQGVDGDWMQSVIWNSGFYLWRGGLCPDLMTALTQAKELLISGRVLHQLNAVKQAVDRGHA